MDGNAPESGSGTGNDWAQQPRPSRLRLIIGCSLLAFLLGLGAMAWIMSNWDRMPFRDTTASNQIAEAESAALLNGAGAPAAAGSAPNPVRIASTPEQMEERVVSLEQRITRVSLAAAAASGHANRAEAMLVAFAARRALDTGQPLGYIEGQLRLLFGDAQPKAVATIANAAAEPVTLGTLRQGLEAVRNAAERGDPREGWWSAAMRELRGLAVIRQAGEPSPELRERVIRARLDIEAGQVESAIDEISALTERPETLLWLEQARRYKEARRALDVIEAAAILEPRAAPIVAPAAAPLPSSPAAQQP
jgi:signal transduction histidine kinase